MSEVEFYVGFGGRLPLEPGKHRLGTVAVSVRSGAPAIVFATSTGLGSVLQTSFGSVNPGREDDHTIRLGEPGNARLRSGSAADWYDSVRLSSGEDALNAGTGPAGQPEKKFLVAVVRGTESVLSVTTTREGFLRVGIFDVHGRLVRQLANEKVAREGVWDFSLSRIRRDGLAAGVYFYLVETVERSARGKVVILQ